MASEEFAEEMTSEAKEYFGYETDTDITNRIYCGPNVLKYGLVRYQVYQDGLPYNVKEAMRECPEIGRLICSTKQLEMMRRKIEIKGTPEHLYYSQVEKAFKK